MCLVTWKIKVVKMCNTISAFKELLAEEPTTQKYQTQQNMLNPHKRATRTERDAALDLIP